MDILYKKLFFYRCIMYLNALVFFIILSSCSKGIFKSNVKSLDTNLTVEHYKPLGNLPYVLDFNDDGIFDIEITGDQSYSGSSGSLKELYIKGLNGSRICYQIHYDTSWAIDIYTGTYDTLLSYNTYEQPASFNHGNLFDAQLNYTDNKLIIFKERYNGSMGAIFSNVIRHDLLTGNFMYFVVDTPFGFHWVKCKPGLPTTIIESCSSKSASSGMVIQE